MRQSFNSEFILNSTGIIGIHTGSDYCAEHEFGIGELRRHLGMDDQQIGIENRRIRNAQNVYLTTTKGTKKRLPTALLLLGREVAFGYAKEAYPNSWRFLSKKFNPTLHCEWCESSCLIAVSGQENVNYLVKLHGQILAANAVLMLAGGAVFKNAGLTLAIVTDIPAKDVELIKRLDEEKIALKREVSQCGIEDKLKAADKRYYALSPKRIPCNIMSSKPSKFSFHFWLNPCDQEKNNHGWFTVEELEQWITGTGPIPKKEA